MTNANTYFKEKVGFEARKEIQMDTISVVKLMEDYAASVAAKPIVIGSLPPDDKLISIAYAEIPYNETKRAWWLNGAKFIRDMLLNGNDR